MQERVIVVGAGLVGCLLSIYLARLGLEVDVFEKRPDIREQTGSFHRSINMAMSARGAHAIRAVGLEAEVLSHTIPCYGRMIHHTDGRTELQPYGLNPEECLRAIPRTWLNRTLITQAEKTARVRFHFGHEAQFMNFHEGTVEFGDPAGARVVHQGVVFGTDGSGSAIRSMMLKLPLFEYSQTHRQGEESYGYSEIDIPPGPDSGYAIEEHALHIWPRRTFMFMGLPDLSGSTIGTLFMPLTGPLSFERLQNREEAMDFFTEHFPDVPPLVPDLTDQLLSHHPSLLVTTRCQPWHWKDKVVLLGDAAHAMVPFFGQGMNCGFEDCFILHQCIERHGFDWGRVFAEFSEQRIPQADAIQDLSLENFIEMRAATDDPGFMLRKAVEKLIESEMPERYISQYSLISHHLVPYKLAREVGVVEATLLVELCSGLDTATNYNRERARQLIDERLGSLMEQVRPYLQQEKAIAPT
ncbi:MAG: kynurenine 3-monooxygenase [Candidatus Xenobia bacterium]